MEKKMETIIIYEGAMLRLLLEGKGLVGRLG